MIGWVNRAQSREIGSDRGRMSGVVGEQGLEE